MPGWKAALIASVPVPALLLLVTTGLHASSGFTQMSECEPPDCGMGLMWIYALYAVSIFTFAVGFALAFVGQVIGRKTSSGDRNELS